MEDCGHDHMYLIVENGHRVFVCPECGWRKDTEA